MLIQPSAYIKTSDAPSAQTPSILSTKQNIPKLEAQAFPTVTPLAPLGSLQLVPLRAWLFFPNEGNTPRLSYHISRRALASKIEGSISRELFNSRARFFFAHAAKPHSVCLLRGSEPPLIVGNTLANGHLDSVVHLDPSFLKWEAIGPESYLSKLKLRAEGLDFDAQVIGLERNGISVISDIDDSIKLSGVADKKQLVANTFFFPYRAVEGMAELYQKWAAEGASFHYVSSTPWQLYPPLKSFLDAEGFPLGSFHLKSIWWGDRSWLQLFASAAETKPRSLAPLFEQFPERKFVLLGDAVEKDPEIYASLVRRYPGQIKKVFIRATKDIDLISERVELLFSDLPAVEWQVFSEASAIESSLARFKNTTQKAIFDFPAELPQSERQDHAN